MTGLNESTRTIFSNFEYFFAVASRNKGQGALITNLLPLDKLGLAMYHAERATPVTRFINLSPAARCSPGTKNAGRKVAPFNYSLIKNPPGLAGCQVPRDYRFPFLLFRTRRPARFFVTGIVSFSLRGHFISPDANLANRVKRLSRDKPN